MTQTIVLQPGVTLRCFPDDRFKQGGLSISFVRPMCREEASVNALIPAVLLRGTVKHPDLRSITLRLDDLYGAAVGALVRRVGDYQTMGLSCGFIDDRYAMNGDRVMEPMVEFLRELLYEPLLENGGFCRSFVESEKKNLISTIESDLNDKRVYAMSQMLKSMCKADSYGVPRLGDKETAAAITPQSAYEHYRKVLKESRIDIFYVGSAPAELVAELVKPLYADLDRDYRPLAPQSAFQDAGGGNQVEEMDVTQGKLCMGLVTPITNRRPEFVAMQIANVVFGAGMTSKLFMNVREKLSLCYSIGSSYYGSKGLVTVAAGIDFANEEQTRAEILRQLEACRAGNITDEELTSAKEAILSSLRGTHDSPGAIESYYGTSALSGMEMTPEEYMAAVEAVTGEQVAAAAATLKLHTTYFLKGVTQ